MSAIPTQPAENPEQSKMKQIKVIALVLLFGGFVTGTAIAACQQYIVGKHPTAPIDVPILTPVPQPTWDQVTSEDGSPTGNLTPAPTASPTAELTPTISQSTGISATATPTPEGDHLSSCPTCTQAPTVIPSNAPITGIVIPDKAPKTGKGSNA